MRHDSGTRNDLAAAYAVAAARDLLVNCWAGDNGFPAVSVREAESGFEIQLSIAGVTATPIKLSDKEGLSIAQHFRMRFEHEQRGEIGSSLSADRMRALQSALIELGK